MGSVWDREGTAGTEDVDIVVVQSPDTCTGMIGRCSSWETMAGHCEQGLKTNKQTKTKKPVAPEAREMDLLIKVLPTQPTNQSIIPGTHITEGQNQLPSRSRL